MEDLRLVDFFLILLRRRKLFLAVSSVLFVISVIFAANWANYRSTAMVEISQAEISGSITSPSGMHAGNLLESMADLRISRLQQKVLSIGSLVEIITKFNLYPAQRKTHPIADVAKEMSKKVRIKLVGSSLANPASATRVSADQLSAIAFELSFDYKTPLLAQQVTNDIVSRFLDEDLKERKKQSSETSAFLETQLDQLKTSLAEQEKKIADFRAAHGDVRPEALSFNQNAATNLMMRLQNLESEMTSNLGRQGALRGQLSAIDPYSRVLAEGRILTTPTIQLKTMRSEYAALTAKYGPEHPDVLKAKRQIKALEEQVDGENSSAPLEARIIDVKGRLQTAEKTYGAKHPDVISLKKQLAKLQKQAAKIKPKDELDYIKKDADNPAYLQTVAQLRTTKEQYKALEQQKEILQKQLEKFQKAIIENPDVERKLSELTRDYENSRTRYHDLLAKKMTTDMSATIEEDRAGQRLVIINPPDLPSSTYPKKILFVVAGFILSLFAGLLSVLGVHLFNQTVVSAAHLEALVGATPLVRIPHISSREDKRKVFSLRLLLLTGGGIFFIIVLIIFSYAVMPLDVFWSVLMRKIGLG